jgi:hypothetical protein
MIIYIVTIINEPLNVPNNLKYTKTDRGGGHKIVVGKSTRMIIYLNFYDMDTVVAF